MRKRNAGGVALAFAAAVAVAPVGAAAQWTPVESERCREGRGDGERHCVVLEATFASEGALSVDGGLNGGVSVEGWERDEVLVRARVTARAASTARAEDLVDAVRLEVDRGRVSADGPSTGRREHWAVSWEIRVPRETDLELETSNGGVSVTDVSGRIRFEALNGGVRLTAVGGDVQGRTTNGGLHVELSGDRWEGAGLDVETTNGGVTLTVPADYSADLETGTVNGGIDIDFPVRVQGRIGRRLATVLGDGGAPVRAVTTNGGVRIARSGRAIR